MEVVYSPLMVAPAQGYSPSAAKPEAVMRAWREHYPDVPVIAPVPATFDDFNRAHCPRYVEDVFTKRRPNGFGTFSDEVNAALPWTSGAMLTAARRALDGAGVVAAPCSGFHHAGWDSGGGFCTFNGLMVAALAVQAERPGLRVGILDYDYHYGNGTDDILDRLGSRDIVHVTAGRDWHSPDQATEFLAHIEDDLAAMADCGIVLYQAGADPHINDPLGGFLRSAQMASRDRQVFAGLRKRGVVVAWNLAGGYQNPLSRVVELHVTTLQMAIESAAESD